MKRLPYPIQFVLVSLFLPWLLTLRVHAAKQFDGHRLIPTVDKTNDTAIYRSDLVSELFRKYNWGDKRNCPRHIRKIGYGAMKGLVLIVRDQKLTKDDLLSHNMSKRFLFAQQAGLQIDSLARVLVQIRAFFTDSSNDSLAVINNLIDLGATATHSWMQGHVLVFTGYIPIYSLEEIAKDRRVIQISQPPLGTHNRKSDYN